MKQKTRGSNPPRHPLKNRKRTSRDVAVEAFNLLIRLVVFGVFSLIGFLLFALSGYFLGHDPLLFALNVVKSLFAVVSLVMGFAFGLFALRVLF